jgi:hypothetical protein
MTPTEPTPRATTTPRLSLSRETLRTLTTDELRLVAGGRRDSTRGPAGDDPEIC